MLYDTFLRLIYFFCKSLALFLKFGQLVLAHNVFHQRPLSCLQSQAVIQKDKFADY